jgi:hypothetical protein
VLFLANNVAKSTFHPLGNLTATRSFVPDMIALPAYVLLAVGLVGFSRTRVRGASPGRSGSSPSSCSGRCPF